MAAAASPGLQRAPAAGSTPFAAAPVGHFDAILMDVRMPVMDGLDAARAIRAMRKADAKTVPIFAMTANAFQEDIKMSIDAGMNAHLTKPIEPVILYEALDDILKSSLFRNSADKCRDNEFS